MTNEQIKNRIELIVDGTLDSTPKNDYMISRAYADIVIKPIIRELVVDELVSMTRKTSCDHNIGEKDGLLIALWYATGKYASLDSFCDQMGENLFNHCYQLSRDIRDMDFPIYWDEIFDREAKQ